MNSVSLILVLAPLVYLTSLLVVRAVRRWAQHHLLDVPNERSSHQQPTPRGGGVAIVVASLFGVLILSILSPQAFAGGLALVVMATLLIAVVSLVDDLRPLSPLTRMTVHLGASLVAIAGVGSLHSVALPAWGAVSLGATAMPIAVIWLVGMTNAYNFMDGIDGLAGMQAVLGGAAWALLAIISDSPVAAGLAVFVCLSSLGFLAENWPPARLFMGDTGSAFLGFIFGVLPLMAMQDVARPERLALTAILMVWPFIFDTSITLALRLRRGENVLKAHRSHLYQRLVSAGFSHRSVTLLYSCLGVLSCALAFTWQLYSGAYEWVPPLTAVLLGAAFAYFVHHQTRQRH